MLEFYKNGKAIKLDAIYDNGIVGKIVIFGKEVYFGENPAPIKEPISKIMKSLLRKFSLDREQVLLQKQRLEI